MSGSIGGLLIVAALGLLLIVAVAFLLRAGLNRMTGGRLGRRRRDVRLDTFLRVMGTRMGRPWMTEELMAVTGLPYDAVDDLLGRARPVVAWEWMDHPVTGEEFRAVRLNRRGVREYGAFAPDDLDEVEHVEVEAVNLRTFTPAVDLQRPVVPDAGEVAPSPAPVRSGGFRHTRSR